MARLVKLGRCKNIVVVAGAGISTASGIPDFRSVVCHSLERSFTVNLPSGFRLGEREKLKGTLLMWKLAF